MTRKMSWRRRVSPGGAITAAVMLTALPALAAAPSGASVPSAPSMTATTAASDTPVQRFGSCVNGGGSGEVLLVMDRSGSLKETDPQGVRIEAAKYFVQQLDAVVSKQAGRAVNIAIAAFDTKYERVADWQSAKGASAALGSALDGLRSQNNGLDTDYWNAMAGARRELAERTKASPNSCAMAVWFSDGEYSVESRGANVDRAVLGDPKPYAADNPLATAADAAAAMEAGKADLCRAGGVADQTRLQGISTVAIGLSAGQTAPDFTFLTGMVTGSGGCGQVTDPTPGQFFEAKNLQDVVFAFDQALSGGQVSEGKVCAGTTVSDDCTHAFVLDASIGSVHVLADSDAQNQRLTLVTPSGARVDLAPTDSLQSQTISAATVAWKSVVPQGQGSVQTISLDLTRTSADGLVGLWGLIFNADTAAGKSRTNLRIYGDIEPTWPDATKAKLTAGDHSEITLGVAHADGAAVDVSKLSPSTVMTWSLQSGNQVLASGGPLSGAAIQAPQTVDLKSAPAGAATLHVTLDVTTQGFQSHPGTKLEGIAKDFLVSVAPPANYPSVPNAVSFDKVDSTNPVSADLAVQGDGCVWVEGDPTYLSTPASVQLGFVSSATSKETCSAGPVKLTLKPKSPGNGLVNAKVKVMVLPKDRSGTPSSKQVTLTMEMENVSKPLLWGTLVGVTLLGVLIPVALLYLVKFLTARVTGRDLAAGTLRGRVSGPSAFTDRGVSLPSDQLSRVVLAGADRRSVTVAGVTIVAKTGLGLTEPGYAVIDYGGRPAGGDGIAARAKQGAKLPLAVQGHWSVALDAADPHGGDVEVTAFTDAAATSLPRVLDDIQAHLADAVAKLRAALPTNGTATAAGASADEWGSPPPGTPGSSSGDAWDASPTQGTPDPWGAPASSTSRAVSGADPWGAAPTPTPPSAPGANPWGAHPTSAPTPPPTPPSPPGAGW